MGRCQRYGSLHPPESVTPVDTQTTTTFFALLALLCNVAAAGIVVVWVAARRSPVAASWRDAIAGSPGRWPVVLAWVVATVSMLGSLYYSEVVHFVPCELCWYQRIAMYPLAVILGIAALRVDGGVRWYAQPLAAAGALIAVYHWLIQRFPSLEAGECSLAVPCTSKYVERFGFVTIPYMAASAFLLIVVLLAVWRPHDRDLAGPARG